LNYFIALVGALVARRRAVGSVVSAECIPFFLFTLRNFILIADDLAVFSAARLAFGMRQIGKFSFPYDFTIANRADHDYSSVSARSAQSGWASDIVAIFSA
jgi:hypothetical protein